MEEGRAVAPISVADNPSASKGLDGEGDEDACIPTPAAQSDNSKASPVDTDSTDQTKVDEEDPEDPEDPVDQVDPVDQEERDGRGTHDKSRRLATATNSEAATRPPEVDQGPAKQDHPCQPVHRRQGSKLHHSRNPSDVCPRVAVIATQEEEENVCSICLDEFCDEDPIAETQCGHGYHLQCIMQWAQRSQECPLCFSQLTLLDEGMNELLPFGEYSSPQEEQAMSNMLANIEFETFLVHLAAAERRQARQQRRENRRRASGDSGHVVMAGSGSSEGDSAVGSPSESMLKTVRRGFASFFLGK